MKKVFLIVIIFTTLLTACKKYGTRLEFNGGELYYTKTVTEEEANRLGTFLVSEGFFEGNPISVLLDKADSVYIFKMVAKEGAETQEGNVQIAQSFSQSISAHVFGGAPVDFHFCDAYFVTKLKVPYLSE
ncbi:MAG: hypothetical protein ACK4IY_07510 [Chitinophagales bacterium]